jgi:thiosulfate dehydrogenase [quinone] large subunit
MSSNSRTAASVVGAIAAVLLLYLINPWVNPEAGSTISQIVTVGFWLSFIVLLVILFQMRKEPGGEVVDIEGPAFTRFLFSNTRAGLFWLPIRLFVGFAWLEAGWHKFTDPAWVGADAGTALASYWERAVAVPEGGRPPITYDWYRGFIQFLLDNGAQSWMTYVITFGELAVGIGLLIGMLTGIAAFFGAFMNMSFLLAGSSSTNPVLFTLAIGLMLAWKVAGWYGVDRYLLPRLGTPWRPGATAGHETRPAQAPST